MEQSDEKDQGKKKMHNMQIFPIPFTLEEIKGNSTITTNPSSNPSKEQIINQALKFHSQGNILEARKLYEYCINQDFNDHRVFSNYGVILTGVGKLKEAELYTRKAIEINPNFAEAHSNLGVLLKDLGKLKEAELSQRKAIELKPNFVEALFNLGNLLIDLGKREEAMKNWKKSVKLKPGLDPPRHAFNSSCDKSVLASSSKPRDMHEES